ncbi:MAG: formate dehydrogenase subunit gamma [Frankiales bacterium]|nr:formate dehydrogenase subunit gamma [Frankiales bacterium]
MSGQEWSAETVAGIVREHAHLRGPLLPVLHAVQERIGWIPPDAVPVIAHELNLSRADVHGVVTFYADFRTEPPGRTVVGVCRGEACQSRGGRDLEAHAQDALGVPFGGTTQDGEVTLDQVFCLGNCALPPSVTVDGRLHGRVDAATFDRLLAEAR